MPANREPRQNLKSTPNQTTDQEDPANPADVTAIQKQNCEPTDNPPVITPVRWRWLFSGLYRDLGITPAKRPSAIAPMSFQSSLRTYSQITDADKSHEEPQDSNVLHNPHFGLIPKLPNQTSPTKNHKTA
jgi:hypothetical protein